MHLYDVGKDHEESMRLISNVHLITRVYGIAEKKIVGGNFCQAHKHFTEFIFANMK